MKIYLTHNYIKSLLREFSVMERKSKDYELRAPLNYGYMLKIHRDVGLDIVLEITDEQ